jgi:hypothetical protein
MENSVKQRTRGLMFKSSEIVAESGCDVEFVYMTLDQLLQKYPEAKHYPLDGDDHEYLVKVHNKSLAYYIKEFAEQQKTKTVQVFTSGIWLEAVKAEHPDPAQPRVDKAYTESNFHLQVKE